jgi:TonB-dependent receptor
MGMLKSKWLGQLCGLITTLVMITTLNGQNEPVAPIGNGDTGTLTGKVIDVDFADGVRGVSVTLEGLENGFAFTDLEGRYIVRDVPVGTYAVLFKKDNFQTQRVTEVEIKKGEAFTLDVPFQATGADFTLDVFEIAVDQVVSQSVILLADRQKSASLSDALSAEDFSRASAGDAAEAMTKITGVNIVDGKYAVVRGLGDRYSNTLMNGAVLPSNDPSKKSVQLDIIPSDLLEKIVTTKSFTPDKPGDFTGGSVEITTKPFPDQFVLTASLGVGYNEATGEDILGIPGRDMDFLGKTDDALPTSIPPTPGEYAVATRFSTTDEAKSLFRDLHSSGWYPVIKSADPNLSFGVTLGDSKPVFSAGNFGYLVSFTHDHNYDLIVDKRSERWIGTPEELRPKNGFDRTESTEEVSWGGLVNLALLPNPEHEISYNYLINTKNTDSVVLGDNGFENTTNVVEAGQAVGSQNLPTGRESAVEFLTTTRLQYTVKELSLHQFKGKHIFPTFSEMELKWSANLSETSEENPDQRLLTLLKYQYPDGESDLLYLSENPKFPFKSYDDLTDEKTNFTVDITIPWDPEFLNSGEFKLGLFTSESDRNSIGRFYSATGSNSIVGDTDSKISFYERFEENVWVDQTFSTEGGVFRPGQVTYIEQTSRQGNVQSYAGTEKIDAVYFMSDIEFKNELRIIFGVRRETTEMDVATVDDFVNVALRDVGDIDDETWLPAFHAVYPLGEDNSQNLRFSYGKTLARPTFREFSPFRVVDSQSGEIYQGNPALDLTFTDNFDLRWEWFIGEADLIAFGVYYKEFSNPIVQTVSSGANASPRYSWENASSGTIQGAELEMRKSLGEFWSVGGNATFIDSEIDPLQLDASGTVFEGQPEYILNINAGYNNPDNGWSANVFYNYVSETLRFIGETVPDIFEDSNQSVDLNVSKAIGKWTVKFTAKNITDEDRLLFYDGINEQAVYESWKPGPSYGLSASYRY